jgi:ribosomal protein L7Ae-like RNA K-turn-binding protein
LSESEGTPSGNDREQLQALGLARKAGRAAIGTRAVLVAGRTRRLSALIVARDASPNALDRVRGAIRNVPLVHCGTRETLGLAVGRGPVAVVGVTDRELARRIVPKTRLAQQVRDRGDSVRRSR